MEYIKAVKSVTSFKYMSIYMLSILEIWEKLLIFKKYDTIKFRRLSSLYSSDLRYVKRK